MKKYVSKQDAQKGSLDPKKPIQTQKQPKQKHEQPEKTNTNQPKNQNQQNQQKPHPQKKKRQNKYYIAHRDITLQTPLPQAPKKIIPKPNREKFTEDLERLKNQKKVLNEQRRRMIQDQRHMIKDTVQNKKTGQVHRSKYSTILKQTNNKRNQIEKEIKSIQQSKAKIQARITELKQKINSINNPKEIDTCSIEELNDRRYALEVKLSTADIDKKAEASIQHEINLISRALLKARPQIELQTEIGKLQDLLDIEYKQLNIIYQELHAKYKEVKEVRRQIGKILEQKKTQQLQIVVFKTLDQIKQEFDGKISKIDSEKAEINEKLDTLKTKFFKTVEQYDDQQDLLYIINRIKQKKQQLKQRQKQRAQKQRKWKEIEQRKKKQQQQRERRAEQRKKQQQQRILKLQKDREQYINRNPNHQKIQMCNFLINYCQMLKPQNKVQKIQQKPIKVLEEGQIKGQQWEKELKKGAHLITGKKNNLDQQAPQKGKKGKKNKQKKNNQQSGFFHNNDIQNRFQAIKILAPLQLEDVDKCIKQLKDKVQIFGKPSEEQVSAYKQRATKQFDRLHQINKIKADYKEKEESNIENAQEQDPDRNNKRKHKNKEVNIKQEDFPEIKA